MKKTALLLLFCFSLVLSKAAPVDVTIAQRAAENFYKTLKSDYPFTEAQLAATFEKTAPDGKSVSKYIYVFNVEDGYVMLSADDCIEPILGFSTESNYDRENVPESMLFFIQCYIDEMHAILESKSISNQQTSAKWAALQNRNYYQTKAPAAVVISPLVTAKWSQVNPYNALCPADASATSAGGHALTGCGATVMGQVIRYWKYPTTGTGSHSYSCGSYGTLSADFGNTTYDYDNMPNTLNDNSAPEKINAVATLLYHCGVAVNMNYGPTASWSNSNNIVSALKTYFGYPNTVQYLERSGYNSTVWTNKVKNELNEYAPLFYGGSGSQGGHVFVCDGYRDDDYFHINWGFGGGYNGYFTLDALNPGPYSFSSSQAIIIGIRGPQLPNAGCEEHDALNLNIYPNPTNSTLFVDLANEGQYAIKIMDMSGRLMFSENVENAGDNLHHAINVQGFSKGLYLLNVEGKQGKSVKKFVVAD